MFENDSMKAMILAAGRGERMGDLTLERPKPLLEVAGVSLIEHQIRRLKRAGFHDIVVNLAWLGDQIVECLGDGSGLGVKIDYSFEPEGALDTGGGIRRALALLGDGDFVVINADVWTDYPFERLRSDAGKGDAFIVLVDNPSHHPHGDFGFLPDAMSASGKSVPTAPVSEGEDGQRAEGQKADRIVHGRVVEMGEDERLTFSGIGRYSPRLFAPKQEEIFPLSMVLRDAIRKGTVHAEHYRGEWADIGTPERLAAIDRKVRREIASGSRSAVF